MDHIREADCFLIYLNTLSTSSCQQNKILDMHCMTMYINSKIKYHRALLGDMDLNDIIAMQIIA